MSETPSLYQLPNEAQSTQLSAEAIQNAVLSPADQEAIARAKAATLDLNNDNDGLGYLDNQQDFGSYPETTHVDTLAAPAETPEFVRKFNKEEIAQVTINIADCLRPARVAAAEQGLPVMSLPQHQYKKRDDYATAA